MKVSNEISQRGSHVSYSNRHTTAMNSTKIKVHPVAFTFVECLLPFVAYLHYSYNTRYNTSQYKFALKQMLECGFAIRNVNRGALMRVRQ